MENIKCLIDRDVYWGEFPESKMDELLTICERDGITAARVFAEQTLKRGEFIFGKGRSDFLYYLNLSKNSVCLDCGCGLGAHTFNLVSHVKEVHAFDQSRKRLRFVARRAEAEGTKNVFLYHSDFEHLPFESGTFDAIVMNGVVEWLGEIERFGNPRDDQVYVLKQMFRLLKPGGRLYIGIENRFAAAYLRGRDHNSLRFTNFMPRFLADAWTRIRAGKPYRTYTYSRAGYRELLQESGFAKKNIEFYTAYPGYNDPQFIIPFDDLSAIGFFLRNFSKEKGLEGKAVSLCSRFPFCLRLLRHFFWSFAIIASK